LSDEFLYSLPESLIVPTLFLVMVVSGEIGHRVGRRRRAEADDTLKSQVVTVQGGMLGLLALLLGFSFAIAESRFEVRKELVVEEANAIGTAALRGRMLAEPHRRAVAALFRDYVDVRLAAMRHYHQASELQTLDDRAGSLQEELWTQAIGVTEKDKSMVPTGLFVQSLNAVIDIKGKRDAALNNHVPESVLLLLFLVAMLTVGMVGYGGGLGERRMTGILLLLSLLLTLVILLIMDLDRPRRGIIQVNQRSMIDLKQTLESANPD
jgi:hypothetical protein